MAGWDLRYFGFMITRDSVFAFVSNIVMHTCAGHQTLQGQGACWSRVCSNLTYWLLLYLSILKNLFLGSREFRFFFSLFVYHGGEWLKWGQHWHTVPSSMHWRCLRYQVGPIPIDDGIGKEVATQITTTMATNKTFYTDSNGRDFIKRVCCMLAITTKYSHCFSLLSEKKKFFETWIKLRRMRSSSSVVTMQLKNEP